jgi:hypothetical protein
MRQEEGKPHHFIPVRSPTKGEACNISDKLILVQRWQGTLSGGTADPHCAGRNKEPMSAFHHEQTFVMPRRRNGM